MKILFCSDPLDSKVVDQEYEQEYKCARKLGMDVHLVSLESVLDEELSKAVKRIPTFEVPERFIYRGWMLKPNDYEKLYYTLQQKNAILINSPTEYRIGHYFPYSYEAIKKATPQSIWLGIEELSNGFDVLFEKMRIFKNKPVMVKDYVKSRKHEWEEACYIPDASDQQRAQTVLRNFIDRQGSELNGGIVIREFIQLEQLANHPKSGMPLSNEYRLFFLHHKLVQCTEYWDEVDYQQEFPNLDSFIDLAKGVASQFFTMDIAKTTGGEWTVIEIGDGQVSGLPSHADLEQFYKSIMELEVNPER
ncbi:ATP-grasp domain-containing protein [Paenibacillus periandrae]|uniref:ATP-grasp domain-containing protein n=1 Tax=Paenibacillus periandrae TaxID=1761741 RepID=UPI001F096D59|nr:ATP-grasp domain-containing protein [Paenibacillus periandrae]